MPVTPLLLLLLLVPATNRLPPTASCRSLAATIVGRPVKQTSANLAEA